MQLELRYLIQLTTQLYDIISPHVTGKVAKAQRSVF